MVFRRGTNKGPLAIRPLASIIISEVLWATGRKYCVVYLKWFNIEGVAFGGQPQLGWHCIHLNTRSRYLRDTGSNGTFVLLIAASAFAEHLFLDSLRHVEKGGICIEPQSWNRLYIFGDSSQDGAQSQFQYLNRQRSTKEKGLGRAEGERVNGIRKGSLQGCRADTCNKIIRVCWIDDFSTDQLGGAFMARLDPGSIPGLTTFSLPTDLDLCQFNIPTAYPHEDIDGVSGVSCRDALLLVISSVRVKIIGAGCNVVV